MQTALKSKSKGKKKSRIIESIRKEGQKTQGQIGYGDYCDWHDTK